ncbi:hypothetical protein [Nostoc sp. C110]
MTKLPSSTELRLPQYRYSGSLNCQEASGVKVSDRSSGVFFYLTNVKFAL